MRKTLAIAAAIAAGSMLGGSAQAGSTTGPVSYIAGAAGDLAIVCTLNVGGACFDVPVTGANSVHVSVVETVNTMPVGFQLGWYNDSIDLARVVDFVPACSNGVNDFPVPTGATHLRVFIDGVINGPTDCAVALPGGVGVLGSIEIAWS